MNVTSSATRCLTCGATLAFAEWSHGRDRCVACQGPPGRPISPRAYDGATAPLVDRFERSTMKAPSRTDDHARHEQMLGEIPEALVDELVAALEAEVAARRERPAALSGPVRDVLDDLGIGKSVAELQWAAWGFAAGFTANVAVAKYAQMSSGAPMSEFLGPVVVGGLAAGAACAAIGWGLAKLRRPPGTAPPA